MARPARSNSSRSPQRKKRGGGGTWLVLFALVALIAAGIVFFPDLLRQFGVQDAPSDLGAEPTEAQDADGSTAARPQQELAARPVAIDGDRLAQAPGPEVDAGTAAAIKPVAGADDSKAQAIIDRAETAYRALNWDDARSLARQVDGLKVSPAIAVRAEDIRRGAIALEEVFTKLNTKDELVRALETHPLLVTITHRGRDENVLPIVDSTTKEPPKTEDPAAWVQSQLQITGSVTVMTTSRIAYPVNAADIADVRPADVDTVLAAKRGEFERRKRRLESGDLARDALAWYEAAKFAYRNRLDELVTTMLDKALQLDPYLAQTIKEDKAQDLFLKMVQQLENDNRAAAAGWKQQLDTSYAETSVYPQASAYYTGNSEQLRLAQAKAAEDRKDQRERARQERLARAQALDDKAAVKAIEQETHEPDMLAAVDTGGSGDAAAAHRYFNQGTEIYSRAQSLGVTEERDQLYAQAGKEFSKAMALYEKLGMSADMVKANQYRYACIKYRRF